MTSTPAPLRPDTEVGTVYVTGGSSGLGAAVVAAVTKAGGTAAVIDLSPPDDPAVAYTVADLSDSAAAADAVSRLVEQVGPVHVGAVHRGEAAHHPLHHGQQEHQLALDRGEGGPVHAASTYFMKSPPKQVRDDIGRPMLEAWIAGEPLAAVEADEAAAEGV